MYGEEWRLPCQPHFECGVPVPKEFNLILQVKENFIIYNSLPLQESINQKQRKRGSSLEDANVPLP